MDNTKSQLTLEIMKKMDKELKTNPLMFESRSITNTWLQDIAISLAIIADWCIKDNKEENKND